MSRNRTLLLVVFIVFVQAVTGQEYYTQGASPDLHLTHKVEAKETWYSIGRTYNLQPKDVASYNKLSIDRPLEIGQTVKIPLTDANFSQSDKRVTGEVPVYHVVQEKEWMYRISVNHNKVPIERLEKWNSISRDEARAGMKLIVGYLKSKGGTTAAATNAAQQPTAVAAKPAQQTSSAPKPPVVTQTSGVSQNGGYFRTQFENNGKNHSGVSGIFKSTSGWNDGKYYALMNNVTVGTIVKVIFPQTNKSIYAKVLGELPDMKESAGLALRISDAAASELGAVNNKFSVDVEY
jgi:LysM repeat protein